MTFFILKKIFGLLLIKATEYFTFLKPGKNLENKYQYMHEI